MAYIEVSDSQSWLSSREDPTRQYLLRNGAPSLDEVLALFPRPGGDPAFDPDAIIQGIERLHTVPDVNTGRPFIDLSVKTGLAMIDLTFDGDHPHYGVKGYAAAEHDGFPPTIIAAVDALSTWGMNVRANQLVTYWLTRFVRNDGTIDYYGTSLSEYGQLLYMAFLLAKRAGIDGWWSDCYAALERMVSHILRLVSQAECEDGFLTGVPEADTKDQVATYFHNNAWIARGLTCWVELCEGAGESPVMPTTVARTTSEQLKAATLAAIKRSWSQDLDDWWLSPMVEAASHPTTLTDGELASYTNYRYWPELLSSGILPAEMVNRVVDARLSAGGQFCGMTRFMDHLDDWPLADYLSALWVLGRKDDFLLSLYGHVAYHQAEGHLTAYEQVTFPPGQEVCPYCLPCQLVAARAARVLV